MGALFGIYWVYIMCKCMNLHTQDVHVLHKKSEAQENLDFWHALALFEACASIHRRQI